MIQYDNYSRVYTESKEEALQYVVKDTRPTHFIKNEAYKKFLEKNPQTIKMFYYKDGRFYLPWCTYKTTRFKDVRKIPEEIKAKMTGDYAYQLEALKATYNCTTKWIMLRSGEWTGKSLLISALYYMYQHMNPTIVVPTQNIQLQLEELLPWALVVCMPTLTNKYNILNDWSMLIIDESHHLSELKRWEFQMWRWPIVWLTATPIRKEFGPEWFEMLFGTLHDTWAESLPVKVYFRKIATEYSAEDAYELTKHLAPDSTQKRRELLYANDHRNNEIVDLSIWAYEKHNKVIVFTDRKTHLESIVKLLADKGCQHIVTLHWWTKKKKFYEDIAKLDKYIIVCTIQCAWEWLNLPDLMVGVCAFNTTDYKTTRQMVWRVRRKSPGKTHGYMIDFRDTIQIEKSRKRYMWSGQRQKHYLSLWFTINHDKKH